MGKYDFSTFEPRHHLVILSTAVAVTVVAASVGYVLAATGVLLFGLSLLELSLGGFLYTLVASYAVYALWFTLDRHAAVLGSRPRAKVVGSTVVLMSALVAVGFVGERPPALEAIGDALGAFFLSAYLVYAVSAVADRVREKRQVRTVS